MYICKTHIMFIFGTVFLLPKPCAYKNGKVDDSLNKSSSSIVCGNEQLCKSSSEGLTCSADNTAHQYL